MTDEPRYRTHCVRCGGTFLTPRIRPTLCEDCAAAAEEEK